jgi:hypothetical protein
MSSQRDQTLDQCVRLLGALHDPDDAIAFSVIDAGSSEFGRLEELADIVDRLWPHNGRANVYFMPNPSDGVGLKTGNVRLARCLFVDFDRSLNGDRGVTFDEAQLRIRDANLPEPTAWVSSGKGIHAYWRLSQPLPDLAEWRGRQRGLIRKLDSDACIHNPNRLMRLPGFRNMNHAERPLCSLIEAVPERVYDMIEFPDRVAEPKVTAGPMAEGSLSRFSRRFLDDGWLAHHGRRHTMFTVACDMHARGWDIDAATGLIMERMRRLGLSESELADCPRQVRNAFAQPRSPIADQVPEDEAEIPADHASGSEDSGSSVADLIDTFPALRPEVVRGLLREGETMNIIAPPKTGKSWLVIDLALSIASGVPWLETYETVQGEVLVLDNELHRETTAFRYREVMRCADEIVRTGNVSHRRRGYGSDCLSRITVRNLRGELRDLSSLGHWIRSLPQGRYKLIVLDAFYRFMPREWDENDNGTMAAVYNLLDGYARHLGAAICCIHHASKGNQAGKAVTDVGAGAGSQSRAADTHLVLRAHEEDKAVVLDAATRSFRPIEPRCFRWQFPFWESASDLDPRGLKTDRPKRKGKSDDGPAEIAEPWTVDRVLGLIPGGRELRRADIFQLAKVAGIESKRLFDSLWPGISDRLASRSAGSATVYIKGTL